MAAALRARSLAISPADDPAPVTESLPVIGAFPTGAVVIGAIPPPPPVLVLLALGCGVSVGGGEVLATGTAGSGAGVEDWHPRATHANNAGSRYFIGIAYTDRDTLALDVGRSPAAKVSVGRRGRMASAVPRGYRFYFAPHARAGGIPPAPKVSAGLCGKMASAYRVGIDSISARTPS